MILQSKIFKVLVGGFGTAILTFTSQLILSTQLTAHDFGLIATLFAVSAAFVPLLTMGNKYIILSDIITNGKSLTCVKRDALKFVNGVNLSILLVALFVYVLFFRQHPVILLILFLFWTWLLCLTEVIASLHQAEYRLGTSAFIWILPILLKFVASCVLFLFLDSDVFLITATVLSGLLVVFYNIRQNRERKPFVDILSKFYVIQKYRFYLVVVRRGLPYALSGFCFLVYYRSDLLMLSWMISAEVAGSYAIFLTLLSAVTMVPSLLSQRLNINAYSSSLTYGDLLRALYKKIAFNFMFMTVVSIVWYITIENFLYVLYGEKYAHVYGLVYIGIFLFFIRCISVELASATANEKTKWKRAYSFGIGACLKVFLNLVFIVNYGIVGALYSFIVSEVVICVLLSSNLSKFKKQV